MRRRGSFLFMLFAGVVSAVFAAGAAAENANRAQSFDRAAKALERRGDATGAAFIRELGLGDPIVPRELSAEAARDHAVYAERYANAREKLRRSIVEPGPRDVEPWRRDRAEAALHLVAYELEQGLSANEPDVRSFLSDAEWMLAGFFRPPERPAVPKAPPPDAEIRVEPERITRGDTALLSWRTLHADHVSLNGEPLDAASGEMIVHPESSTYYAVTAVGPGGSSDAGAAVEVRIPKPWPPPRISLTATPERIIQGRATALKWLVRHARRITLDRRDVAESGSMLVNPAATRAYVMTAEGPGGMASASCEVIVIVPRSATASAPPAAAPVGRETAVRPPVPVPSPVASMPALPAAMSTIPPAPVATAHARDSVSQAPVREEVSYTLACDTLGRPVDSAAWTAASIAMQLLRRDAKLRMRLSVTLSAATGRGRATTARAILTRARDYLAATFALKKSRFVLEARPLVEASPEGVTLIMSPLPQR